MCMSTHFLLNADLQAADDFEDSVNGHTNADIFIH